jgi:serine/threonine protein kinase
MNPERWQQIKKVYQSALGLDPGQREEFLKKACVGDESLFKEVTSLLAQDGKSEGLFDSPAVDAVAKAVAEEEVHRPQQNLIGRTPLHYRIEEKIGEGGMGEVYRTRDTRLDRTVSIKILPAEFASDEERMRRFRREAKAASALNHPNVATIHDVRDSEGVNYIVMEYVEGKTLDELIGRKGMHLNDVLKYGLQIADALASAHEAGIVHRDLKPGNVMVTAKGQVKVLDFGLAKLREIESFAHDEYSPLIGTGWATAS